jgi:hypothetical protein
MKFTLPLVVCLALAALLSGGTARAVTLVAGGDFESPPLGAPGYFVVPAGNYLGPWLVGNDPTAGPGNNVTLEQFPALPAFNPWLTAHGGLQYLDLTGVANQPGSYIEQVLSTTPGLYYQLSYWAGSANSPFHTFPITITALVIDQPSASILVTDIFTTTATPGFNQVIWELHVLPPVLATSTQTRIRFLNSFSQQDACLLDDIGFDLAGAVPTTTSTWGSVKRLFDR